MDYRLVVLLIFLGFAILELLCGRLLNRDKSTRKDVIIESGSGTILPLVVVPSILAITPYLAELVVPDSEGWLSHWSAWLMFLTLVFADDFTQYWWHRSSHSFAGLYRLHRAHHSAEYMSVRIAYRNNVLYYAMMPGLWLSGVLLYWGFAPVYYFYAIAKMAVIIGAHSSVPWDAPLFRFRLTRPVVWLLARVISTPSTHAAHHGKHSADGVTHYHGNYGNFFFVWDLIFGTAKINEGRPQAYGLENVEPKGWREEFLWPS